jgi:hypothetical protein
VIVLLLALLGVNSFVAKYRQTRKHIALIFLLFFICLTIGCIGFGSYLVYDYYYKMNHRALEYSVTLNSLSGGYELVYIPLSANANLQNSVQIKSGSGTVAVIDTDYGAALLVHFKGNITISGKVDTTHPLNNYSLTLVNQTRLNEWLWWNDIEYWIFYLPSNSSAYNCSFEFSLAYSSEYRWVFETCNGSLTTGWQTYWGRWGGLQAAC